MFYSMLVPEVVPYTHVQGFVPCFVLRFVPWFFPYGLLGVTMRDTPI